MSWRGVRFNEGRVIEVFEDVAYQIVPQLSLDLFASQAPCMGVKGKGEYQYMFNTWHTFNQASSFSCEPSRTTVLEPSHALIAPSNESQASSSTRRECSCSNECTTFSYAYNNKDH